MHELKSDLGTGPELYPALTRELAALLEGERDLIANAANCRVSAR
jgi:hypothetical protein